MVAPGPTDSATLARPETGSPSRLIPPPVCLSGDAGGSGAPEAVSPDLVGAMVPAQILQEDEIVLILTKPSLFYIFYTSLPFVVVVLLMGALAEQIAANALFLTPSSVAWITGLLCVGRMIWSLLVWTSHIYMLTNRRIVTIKGVINVSMFQAPLRKIQNTNVYRGFLQRLVGTGTIGFSTASGEIESTWVMINRPLETHEQVVAAINKLK